MHFTTLWTPCCAAPTRWLTTTGIWVWALTTLERQFWEEAAQIWQSLHVRSTVWTKPLLPFMKSVAPITGKATQTHPFSCMCYNWKDDLDYNVREMFTFGIVGLSGLSCLLSLLQKSKVQLLLFHDWTPHAFCFCSYRLADHPPLSAEFTKHLKRLPQSLDTSQNRALYRRLIDTYGTHYIHQVSETCWIHRGLMLQYVGCGKHFWCKIMVML